MKAFKLLTIGFLLILAVSAQSQLSVRVNLGTPPAWGPSGYSDVRYYYLPDVQAYYDVETSMFIYISGNRWVHRSYLPARYRNYDLYNGYKVVMNDYRGNTPYSQYKEHRVKYARGYHREFQKTNGERNNRNYNERNAHSVTQPVQREERNAHTATQPVRNENQNNDRQQVRRIETNRNISNDNNRGRENSRENKQKEGRENGREERR
jgi:hypothetical protein